MKPHIHAINSTKKWGGIVSDYIGIHNFMDISKLSYADIKHRAILHNSLGPYIAEKIFGIDNDKLSALAEKFSWTEEEISEIKDLISSSHQDINTSIINSDGDRVFVRDIAEEHIIEDMGKIPSVSEYLDGMPNYEWLGHRKAAIKRITMDISKYIKGK